MDRHGHDGPSRGSHSKTLRLFNEFDSLNFVVEAAGRTVEGMKGRHGLRNPHWVGFLLKVFKGCFGLFLLMIIKLVV